VTREDVLHHVRGLGALVHRQRVLGRVVVGQYAARLIGHTGVAGEIVGLLDHQVGAGEGLVEPFGDQFPMKADVVAQLRVDDHRAFESRPHLGHRGQHVPVDTHLIGGVLGLAPGLGHDRRHGLALRADPIDGDGVLFGRLDALQMAQHAHPGRAIGGQRAAIDHRDHTGTGTRRVEPQRQDARMGVRAANEHDVRKTRHSDVVEVAAPALQQLASPGARQALADESARRSRVGVRQPRVVLGHEWEFRTRIHGAARFVAEAPRIGVDAGCVGLRSTDSMASTIAWYPVHRQ
jgi:hypothetical protein